MRLKGFLFCLLCLSASLHAATVAQNLHDGIPISDQPITPDKGKIQVANGTAFRSLGAGTDGYVLTADSTQLLGVKWAVSSGAPFSDNAALVKNSADATKLLIVSAANVTAGQTRTLAALDKSYTLGSTDAGDLSSGTLPDARFPATLPAISGVNLTFLSASNLGSGTVPDARFPATLPVLSGVNITALNASNLGSGTVPDARFPATLPAASGVNLTALNASNLGSGTIPDARFPAVLPAISGANLTNLPSGLPVVDTTSIVKGSGDATKLLRFEVDGFSAGTTRVMTPPNANATIAGLEVAELFTAQQQFGAAPTTADSAAHLLAASSAIGKKPLVVQGIAGQTANISEWQLSDGTPKVVVSAAGYVGMGQPVPTALFDIISPNGSSETNPFIRIAGGTTLAALPTPGRQLNFAYANAATYQHCIRSFHGNDTRFNNGLDFMIHNRDVQAPTDTPTYSAFRMHGNGALEMFGTTSGSVALKPAAAAGSSTFTLPAADGSAGTVLETDGSGNLSFTAAPSITSLVTSDTVFQRSGVLGGGWLVSNITNSASLYLQSQGKIYSPGSPTVSLTNVALTTNVATITATGHNTAIGSVITISSCSDTNFNGTWRVTGVSSTTFTFAFVHADIASAPATGTVTGVSQLQLGIPDAVTPDSTAAAVFTSSNATKPLTVQGASSQTANLTEWQDSTGAFLSGVTPAGQFAVSTTAAIGKASSQELAITDSVNSKFLRLCNFGLIYQALGTSPSFSSGSVTSNVATINTTAIHRMTPNMVVTISGSTGVSVDGTYYVLDCPSTTSFRFSKTVGNGSITAATITVDTLLIGNEPNTAVRAALVVANQSNAQVCLAIQPKNGQTTDLQQWQDATGTVLSAVNQVGVISGAFGSPVTSATAITPTGNVFHVTGTTTITSITSTSIRAGTKLTIIFDGALTFTDGSNLKLAGNFTTAADATISLIYDGTNWYELSRSTN